MYTIAIWNCYLQGVDALDFSERMGLGSLQTVSIHTEKIVELPDWYVRARTLDGNFTAELDLSWLQPGEICKGSHNFELVDNLSAERAVQLVDAFLHDEQERRIADLESSIQEAIPRLNATRNQFVSDEIMSIREMLESVLYPTSPEDDEN
jgi:low affinity Fe/Cu permease